jgi:uncharacterized protein (TIGR02231 family)
MDAGRRNPNAQAMTAISILFPSQTEVSMERSILRLTAAAVVASAFAIVFAADRTTADSRIVKVTAYTDRALVVRQATVTIQKGDQEIRFANLPVYMDRNSIQVSGKGNAVIRDVRSGQEQTVLLTDVQLQKLMDQRDSLNDSVRVFDDRISVAQNQKNFIENIAKKVTAPAAEPEKAPGPELDPAKWNAMVGFYRKSISQLNEEIRQVESYKKDLGTRIDKINRQINDRGAARSKTKPYVDVVVQGREAGEVELELSYVVHGVSWTPSYTLRMASNAKTMNVTYNAAVRQNTGEDWNGVRLNLSTAAPAVGGTIPKLQPWYVDIFTPRSPEPEVEVKQLMMKKKGALAGRSEMGFSEKMNDLAAAPPQAPRPAMAVENSGVERGVYSAVFSLAGAKEIASDNQNHLVAIASFDVPAEFSYFSVPKLQAGVFLNAKVTNSTDYTLLPGPTSVFFENSFVANGAVELVAPSQTFETPLGTDEQIHIERKLINRFQKDEGLISKHIKVVYKYSIILRNNKKMDESVTVRDQIPNSRNQDIVVTLLPAEKSPVPGPTVDKTGIVEWKVPVKAGQEVTVPFSFSVEYPKDIQVEGL